MEDLGAGHLQNATTKLVEIGRDPNLDIGTGKGRRTACQHPVLQEWEELIVALRVIDHSSAHLPLH